MAAQPENPSRPQLDLQHATQHFRLLADPTRLRLLLLLNQEELSVAEQRRAASRLGLRDVLTRAKAGSLVMPRAHRAPSRADAARRGSAPCG